MVIARAALARYATRQAAQEIARKLEREGFVLRLIPTPAKNRIISGSTIGWCATPAPTPSVRLPAWIKSLVSRWHRYVSSAELQGLGIPPDALATQDAARHVSDYVVIVSGTLDHVRRGVGALKAHHELLKLDLY